MKKVLSDVYDFAFTKRLEHRPDSEAAKVAAVEELSESRALDDPGVQAAISSLRDALRNIAPDRRSTIILRGIEAKNSISFSDITADGGICISDTRSSEGGIEIRNLHAGADPQKK